jgi:hypothetical protein
MAKKVRRVRRSRARSKVDDQENGLSGKATGSSKPRQDSAERFRLEYAYVLRDLRHVLLLALAMFVLLVLLNLVLPFLV